MFPIVCHTYFLGNIIHVIIKVAHRFYHRLAKLRRMSCPQEELLTGQLDRGTSHDSHQANTANAK